MLERTVYVCRPSRRGLLALAAAALLTANSALAAGPEPKPVLMPQVETSGWDGPYWGFTLGIAGSDGEAELAEADTPIIKRDVSLGLFPQEIDDFEFSAIGGATLGYNMQRGRLVGGIEFDVSIADAENELGFARIDPGGAGFEIFEGANTATRYSTDIDALVSLRLRAGVARGRSLFYGTAGIAGGKVENRFTLDLVPLAGDPIVGSSAEEDTRYGYIVGVGVEHRTTERVSLKAEALYFDLEDATLVGRVEEFPEERISYEFENDGVLFRVGMNFAF